MQKVEPLKWLILRPLGFVIARSHSGVFLERCVKTGLGVESHLVHHLQNGQLFILTFPDPSFGFFYAIAVDQIEKSLT